MTCWASSCRKLMICLPMCPGSMTRFFSVRGSFITTMGPSMIDSTSSLPFVDRISRRCYQNRRAHRPRSIDCRDRPRLLAQVCHIIVCLCIYEDFILSITCFASRFRCVPPIKKSLVQRYSKTSFTSIRWASKLPISQEGVWHFRRTSIDRTISNFILLELDFILYNF